MTSTWQSIWESYPKLQWGRKLYVLRLNTDGTYESDWYEISQYLLKDGSVNSVEFTMPNSSYSLGEVRIANAKFSLLNPYGEMSDETFNRSIFKGFVRDGSLIKIVDHLVNPDDETDVVEVTTFQGFIDDKSAVTEQGYEEFTARNFLTLLKDKTIDELELTGTTISQVVYNAINNPYFTEFFNVSNSSTYINPGYNAAVDLSQYEKTTTIFDLFQDLAKGNSIFYVDPDDNYFYFVDPTPTATVKYSFTESNNRKIKIYNYKSGADRQFDQWYWEDSNISKVTAGALNPKLAKPFKIDGITDNTPITGHQQLMIDKVYSNFYNRKPYFKMDLPYFPIIRLRDRITVQSFGQAPENVARFGSAIYGESVFGKPAGIVIASTRQWKVTSIKHDKNLRTTLELEEIL